MGARGRTGGGDLEKLEKDETEGKDGKGEEPDGRARGGASSNVPPGVRPEGFGA